MKKQGKKSRRTHDEMRHHVCLYCLKNGCTRKVTERLVPMIKKNVCEDFDLLDVSFPVGLCQKCCMKAFHDESYKSDLDYEGLRRRFRSVSGDEQICKCYICIYGRVTPFNKVQNITSKEEFATSPEGDVSKISKTCKKCLQTNISPGRSHDCSVANRVDNVLEWLPNDVKQQIASSVISKQMNNNCENNKTIELKSRRGRPMKFKMASDNQEPSQVSYLAIDKLKQVLRLSGKKTLKMNQGIRMITKNKKIIPSNYKAHLASLSKKERSFLDVSKVKLNSSSETKTVVHVKNLGDYIEHVKIERKLSDNLLVKIIGDTGGNFFKLSLSIIDLDNLPSDSKKKKDDMFGDYFSDNGVQKLLLIGIMAKGKEDYELVKSVFDLIDFKVPGVHMIFTGDQKFINIVNGLGSHTSMHPCSWCHDDKSFLGTYPDLRTFGHLRLCYQKYKEAKDAGINFCNDCI